MRKAVCWFDLKISKWLAKESERFKMRLTCSCGSPMRLKGFFFHMMISVCVAGMGKGYSMPTPTASVCCHLPDSYQIAY